MKTLLLAALTLALSTSAFAAQKGKLLVSCSASDGDYVELRIYANPNGTIRASVVEESFGGSYPKFVYDVKKVSDADALDKYVGKGFVLQMKADRQARLTIDGNSNEMDCR